MLLGATLLLLCVIRSSNEDGDWLKCKPKPGCSIARCDPRPGHWFENVDKLNDYSILCQKNEASDDPGMVTDYADVLEELAKLKGRLERSEREGSETKVELKILERENARVKSQMKEMESRMEKERNESESALNNELKRMVTDYADVLEELSKLKGRLERSEREGSETKAELKILERENARVKSQMKVMESRMEQERNESESELKDLEEKIESKFMSWRMETEEDMKKVKAWIEKRNEQAERPTDCSKDSGVTQIFPKTFPKGTDVYCDATTRDGNWIVFQRRQDGSVNFKRDWTDYVNGFGRLRGEYWMGLKKLHRLMNDGDYELRIDLGDWDGNRRYAKYSTFSVGGPSDNYRLRIDGYSGTAGNSMIRNGTGSHDNQQFSARDRDNDAHSSSCSQKFHGGWWFNSCYNAHLNGIYYDERNEENTAWHGIIWDEWKGSHYSLKFTEMKFRRKQN